MLELGLVDRPLILVPAARLGPEQRRRCREVVHVYEAQVGARRVLVGLCPQLRDGLIDLYHRCATLMADHAAAGGAWLLHHVPRWEGDARQTGRTRAVAGVACDNAPNRDRLVDGARVAAVIAEVVDIPLG